MLDHGDSLPNDAPFRGAQSCSADVEIYGLHQAAREMVWTGLREAAGLPLMQHGTFEGEFGASSGPAVFTLCA